MAEIEKEEAREGVEAGQPLWPYLLSVARISLSKMLPMLLMRWLEWAAMQFRWQVAPALNSHRFTEGRRSGGLEEAENSPRTCKLQMLFRRTIHQVSSLGRGQWVPCCTEVHFLPTRIIQISLAMGSPQPGTAGGYC